MENLAKGHKDPIRNSAQSKIESIFKENYERSLKVGKVRVAQIIKRKNNG